ncbi:MAG: hypothetical protein ACRENZ_04570 [Thermodesulfobacteriota bacterium]
MGKKEVLEKTVKEAFVLRKEIGKIICLLAQELASILKDLRYKLGRAAIPGIGEFSKKDVLIAILDELREVKWELESVKKHLREIEKTLEERKIQEVDTELKVEIKQFLWEDVNENNDNEDRLFLWGWNLVALGVGTGTAVILSQTDADREIQDVVNGSIGDFGNIGDIGGDRFTLAGITLSTYIESC